jgi:hypothetical protein
MSDDTFTPATTLLTGQRLIDPSLREPQLERSVCDLGADPAHHAPPRR